MEFRYVLLSAECVSRVYALRVALIRLGHEVRRMSLNSGVEWHTSVTRERSE